MRRVMRSIWRFVRSIVENQLVWIVSMIVVFALVSGYAILLFEKQPDREEFATLADGIWWAVVTMTTVGYGDEYPITTPGRIIGVALMFSSIGLVSVFTATISSIFVARKIREGRGLEEVDFEDHVLICGWNAKAIRVVDTLYQSTSPPKVVLVSSIAPDDMDNVIKAHSKMDIRFVRGDYTKEEVLDNANIRYARAAILLPDLSDPNTINAPDQRTILGAHVIRSINPEMKVYAHLLEEEYLMDLKRAEVDGVVVSDAYSGELLAEHVASPGTPQVVDLLLNDQTQSELERTPVPAEFVGRKFMDLFVHFKQERVCILIGFVREAPGFGLDDEISGGNREILDLIKRKVQEAGINTRTKSKIDVQLNPPNEYVIRESDYAIVIRNA
jgi:voltage-gated potassium channel